MWSAVWVETWQLLEVCGLWAKGMPPVAGGVLDQTQSFHEAREFVEQERQRAMRERGLVEYGGQLMKV